MAGLAVSQQNSLSTKKLLVALVVIQVAIVVFIQRNYQMFTSQIGTALRGNWTIPNLNSLHIFDTSGTTVSNENHSISQNLGLKGDPGGLDIHIEDGELGHVWDVTSGHQLKPYINDKDIAIGMGITSRKLKWSSDNEIMTTFPFFKTFLKSFCDTCSIGYNYHFYLAFDNNDAFFTKVESMKRFHNLFHNFVNSKCPKETTYSIHYVQCSHSKMPAHAQNDAMIEAYLSNMAYYYRINDDTTMVTKGWVEKFIAALAAFDPPNIGSVGPKHKGGNMAILTYDFTHFSHIHVHGFYYPREFTDWFADRWVTDVYKPGRTNKLSDVHLKHTMEKGQRYPTRYDKKKHMNFVIRRGKERIQLYLNGLATSKDLTADGTKIISISLYGKNPRYTWGVLRYAQLVPILLPSWMLRVYIPESFAPENFTVSPLVVNKLETLGAQVMKVPYAEFGGSLPFKLSRYQVIDDPGVNMFLIRDADTRIIAREIVVINKWENTTKDLFCIRDHPKQSVSPLTEGLIGGRGKVIRDKFGSPVEKVLKTLKPDENSTIEQTYLKLVWDKMNNDTVCYDSVSCWKWEHSDIFPVLRNNTAPELYFVGQKYNEFEIVVGDDEKQLRGLQNNCSVKL